MPLFDTNTATSVEALELWNVADFLAECTAAHDLSEATGNDAEKKAITWTKIVLGPHLGPADGDQERFDELANKLVEFQITPPTEGGSDVVESGGSFETNEGGQLLLIIRRHVRPAELAAAPDGRTDVYLYFLDRVATLAKQISQALKSGRNELNIKLCSRQIGPVFGQRGTKSANGELIHCRYAIGWGLIEAE